MTCPNCAGGVTTTRMPNAPELECFTCSACSLTWSLMDCDTRGCRDRAVACCRLCNKFRCRGHGIGKSGACEACKRRTANVVRGPRETRWGRTANRD